MKHEGMNIAGGLPDAPLAMPTQVLERRRGVSVLGRLRAMLAAFPRLTA